MDVKSIEHFKSGICFSRISTDSTVSKRVDCSLSRAYPKLSRFVSHLDTIPSIVSVLPWEKFNESSKCNIINEHAKECIWKGIFESIIT